MTEHVKAEIDGIQVSGRADIVATFADVYRQMREDDRAWIARLRAEGYKAAHPNDGWVDRKKNIITFCYPHYNDGAKAGDLVMLGWSCERWNRPVRLLGPATGLAGGNWGRWFFEDVGP